MSKERQEQNRPSDRHEPSHVERASHRAAQEAYEEARKNIRDHHEPPKGDDAVQVYGFPSANDLLTTSSDVPETHLQLKKTIPLDRAQQEKTPASPATKPQNQEMLY